jgi:hypothetical protein
MVPSYVDRFLASDAAVDPPFQAAEVALTLRQQFGVASVDARRVFVYSLERGPDLDEVAWPLRHGEDGSVSEPIDIERNVTHWQRRRLLWFQDRLPAELHALAARLGIEPKVLSFEEQSLAETEMYVGPATFSVGRDTSPKTLDELRALTVDELLAFLRGWTPSAPSSPFGSEEPTAQGLADVLRELVSSDPSTMAALTDPSALSELVPEYVHAVAKGIAASDALGAAVPWTAVLSAVTAILTTARAAVGEPAVINRTTQPWVWAARAGIELLRKAARDDKLDAANVDEAWRAIELAINIGGRFDGETPITSADDLVSAGVNRFSGDAVGVLIDIGLAERRRGGDSLPSHSFTTLLDKILAADAKPAVGELGRRLPWVAFLAAPWVEKALEPLTDGRDLMNPVECPLWAGYILGHPFDIRTFRMARAVYGVAARCIDPSAPHAKSWSLTEHFAQRVVLGMMQGAVKGDDEDQLLPTVFQRVPVADRKQAYWLIYSVVSDSRVADDGIVQRVLAFWEWRLERLEALEPLEPQRVEESIGLTWLIFAGALPAAAALPLARRTVALSDGKLALDNEIWDRAIEFSSIDPVMTYAFAKPIVLAALKSDWMPFPDAAVKQIVSAALDSGDAGTVADATAFIHQLGERGFDTFGGLLAEG